MIATKKDITTISKYLWTKGHGGKKGLATSIGCKQSEISRLLRGGTISEEKFKKILRIAKTDK